MSCHTPAYPSFSNKRGIRTSDRSQLPLELDNVEDSSADVDLNVVMTGDGRLVGVQATAERVPFDRDQLDELLELGAKGIARIKEAQGRAVAAPRG
jgi:ribonuclease PH